MKWSGKRIVSLLNGILFCVCILAAYIGFGQYITVEGEKFNFWTKIYSTMQLFVLEFNLDHGRVPALVNFARFLAPVVITSTVLSIIFFNLQNYFNRFIINLSFNDHIVFCGLSTKTFRLAKSYANLGHKVLIIEKNPDNYYLNLIDHRNIRFIIGCAENEETLLKAKIHKASEFYALTESDKTNINFSKLVNKLLREAKSTRAVKINLHLSDPRNLNIFKNFQEKTNDLIDIHAFNIFQKSASLIAYNFCPDQFLPVITEDEPPVHVLVHGLNKTGIALVAEIAQLYHFTNLKKTRLTIVDEGIKEKSVLLFDIYPFIDKVLDLEFEESSELNENHFFDIKTNVSVCFICCETDSESLTIARLYRQEFVNSKITVQRVNPGEKEGFSNLLYLPKIVVVLPKDPDFINLFSNIQKDLKLMNIDLFEMYPSVCSKLIISDDIELYDDLAMQIHNIYRNLDSAELKVKWNELTDEQKDWNRYPARHLAIKLRFLGAEIENGLGSLEEFDFSKITSHQKEVLAKAEHNRWVAEKLMARFRPTVSIKDEELRNLLKTKLHLHRDLKTWEELSAEDQNKDSMLINDIQTVAARLKKKIVFRSDE